ncbi:Solute carrier family 35 member G1 [Holothuria leucospilota]|uniref:Solute carrier family 35 member G1 n=1 Tax=Holothuria leucospilota TaxID=206669 RepID=A0A9Q0YCW6_HOLLE|nr:Solute carrier family 35 member G1 [Holothuria leucospilota]
MISRYKGFAFGLASACCYACSTATVSNLSNDIGPSALSFVRMFVSAFLCLTILCNNGVTIQISSVDEFKLHLGLSLFGVTSIWCQFYAYQNTPTADACAIIYAYPGLNGLLARIFFKEPFGCFEMVLVLSTLTGVVLVTRPPFLFDHQGSTLNFIPPLVAFGGTISVSLSTIFMRAMGRQNIHPLKIVFWISLLCVLYLIITVTLLKEWYLPWTWMLCCVSWQ